MSNKIKELEKLKKHSETANHLLNKITIKQYRTIVRLAQEVAEFRDQRCMEGYSSKDNYKLVLDEFDVNFEGK